MEGSKSWKMTRASPILLGARARGRRVAPDVEVALAAAGRRRRARWNQGCWSEVWLRTSSVMTRRPRRWASSRKASKSCERAVAGVDVGVIGDVVAVVPQGRGVEGQQPDGGDAQVLEVVEPLGQAAEVADAVAVAVLEGADVDLVDDGVLVPEGIVVPHAINLLRIARLRWRRHRGAQQDGPGSLKIDRKPGAGRRRRASVRGSGVNGVVLAGQDDVPDLPAG